MTDKQELRKKYKNIDKSEYSHCLTEKLKQTREYREAKNIMIFYPLAKEVNLLELLNDKSKEFYLPKISDKDLLCCHYKTGEILITSKFGTSEPTSEPCSKLDIDLVIVPALVCDENKYRLGYGGGFYDRVLADYSGKKICCIPKKLVIKTVCPDCYDIPMDLIITD